jgi:hypothetical protein
MKQPIRYYRVWFTNGSDRTAGVVCDTKLYPMNKTTNRNLQQNVSIQRSDQDEALSHDAGFRHVERGVQRALLNRRVTPDAFGRVMRQIGHKPDPMR